MATVRASSVTFPSCGHPKRHRTTGPHDSPKYGLLFAAGAGCLSCVRYWHEYQGVPLSSASNNHKDWDVRSYAHWSTSENAQEVLDYLDQAASKVATSTEIGSSAAAEAPSCTQKAR